MTAPADRAPFGIPKGFRLKAQRRRACGPALGLNDGDATTPNRLRPTAGRISASFRSLAYLFLSLFTLGCHTSRDDFQSSGGAFAPLPPVFLTGPVALLLTNTTGFSAHLVMKTDSLDPQQKVTSGELFGHQSTLLFAPDPGKTDKKFARGGFSFVWDVATNRGVVLSEALQAYAPVTMNVAPTNLTSQPAPSSGNAGQPGEAEEAFIQSSDGSRTGFRVVRSPELHRFPVFISSLSNLPPFTISFSKVRFQTPPADLFAIPNGFTKYESAEAMMTELVMRQHNLRRDRSTPSTPEPVYDSHQRR